MPQAKIPLAITLLCATTSTISKIRERAKAVKGISDELPDEVPEKKNPSFMNSLRKKFFKS